jgi:hypothetical protein
MTMEPCDWLVELHSLLWGCQDLRPNLFHKVEITVSLYNALVECLKKFNSDHNSPNYDARVSYILSTKLQTLEPFTSPSLPAKPSYPNNKKVKMKGEKDLGQNSNGDSGENADSKDQGECSDSKHSGESDDARDIEESDVADAELHLPLFVF